ncbi:MAG: endolytic transglycosylase MltG [Rubricoccaceae bacterium]
MLRSKGFFVALALALLALAGAGAWLAFLPNTSGSDPHRGVRLPPGTTFEAAIDSLESSGGLASATSMRLFGRLTGWGDQVKTGHYVIAPGMSNWAMLDKIRKGLQDPIRITIPAGSRPQTVAGTLARQLGADSTEILAAFSDEALARELGTDTAHLFGRMRANTYDILWTTDARRAITRIHAWYERFWTDERRARAEQLGLTPDEVLTLASIVEWEARLPEERPRVAGVYLNRLLGRTPAGRMRLQADPTVQYALMQADGQPMRRLFLRDYQFPSPYNTYLIDGLPPGPITNPSESSIDAVLNDEGHDYLFFVANGTGGHTFTRTLAEHNRAAAEWSRWLSEQVRIREERERAAAQAAPATN